MGMAKTTNPQTANCSRCHALLTDPRRVAKGIGRRCEQLDRQERAAFALTRDFKGAESARVKALELIADRAIVPTRHDGQFLAVSSDGTNTYVVDTLERSCTCKGHQRVGRCFHMVAADVLEITTDRRRAYALAA